MNILLPAQGETHAYLIPHPKRYVCHSAILFFSAISAPTQRGRLAWGSVWPCGSAERTKLVEKREKSQKCHFVLIEQKSFRAQVAHDKGECRGNDCLDHRCTEALHVNDDETRSWSTRIWIVRPTQISGWLFRRRYTPRPSVNHHQTSLNNSAIFKRLLPVRMTNNGKFSCIHYT